MANQSPDKLLVAVALFLGVLWAPGLPGPTKKPAPVIETAEDTEPGA